MITSFGLHKSDNNNRIIQLVTDVYCVGTVKVQKGPQFLVTIRLIHFVPVNALTDVDRKVNDVSSVLSDCDVADGEVNFPINQHPKRSLLRFRHFLVSNIRIKNMLQKFDAF